MCYSNCRSEFKTCPKCRVEIQDTNSLIKLYFGTSTNTDELNNEIDTLLDESEVCRKKIDFMLQEMNKNVSHHIRIFPLPPISKQFSFTQLKIIDKNTREIAAKKQKLIRDEADNENGAFKLKNLAVLLSRSDELKRIQDYYDSINN